MDEQCKANVVKYDGLARYAYQCTRKAVKDGFCKQHHPDTAKERAAKNHAKWEEKRKRQSWYVLEQLRAAIWSDDSTPEEMGKRTPEDAARFVSGLRAEIASLRAENARLRASLSWSNP